MGKFNLNQLLTDVSRKAAPGGGDSQAPTARPVDEIVKISVFDLIPSEDNFYSMNDIDELKSKIELAGKVLQNLVVVPLDAGKYKVIAGHRRRAASIALVEEGKPEYEFVPCIIEADEADAEVQAIREEIMLIATNSQREKTAWDKLEEVRRTRALLERIKKQEGLPGDMRKLVAQTLNTSPAQIGRFDAITRNLSPEFTEELKTDKINISTAYELSGLSAEEQAAAFEEYRRTGEISIKAARERKQEAEPTPAEEAAPPSPLQPEPPQAQERPETPPPATQTAADAPPETRQEETTHPPKTPAEGRWGQQDAPQPAPQERQAEGKAPDVARFIEQLQSLRDYCAGMDESDTDDGSRVWELDVDALEYALSVIGREAAQ